MSARALPRSRTLDGRTPRVATPGPGLAAALLTWAVALTAAAQDIPPPPRIPSGARAPGPGQAVPTAPDRGATAPGAGLDPLPREETQESRPDLEPLPPGVDLTTRYRLREGYTARPNGEGIGQYQVAFKETIDEVIATPQAAPRQSRNSRLVRYSERPVEVGPGDDRLVPTLIRRYEAAQVEPNPWERSGGGKFLDNLTIWYATRAGQAPELIVLTPDRAMLDPEYVFATDSNPYMPNLAFLLPDLPVRLREPWAITASALAALLGSEVAGGSATAELVSVKPSADGSRREATIRLGGSVVTMQGRTLVNAQIVFTFTPGGPARPGSGLGAVPAAEAESSDTIDAVGGITEIRLAQDATDPGQEGDPSRTVKRRLILQRRWPGQGPELTIPATPPAATPENSWLISSDPKGKFHLRHPQEYMPDYRFGAETLALVRSEGTMPELVLLRLIEGQQPRPEEVFEAMLDEKRQLGLTDLPSPLAKLPAEVVPGVEIYRREAVLTPPRNTGEAETTRLYFDGYLALFPRNVALTVAATSSQDRAKDFRAEVEAILKTFRLGPPGGGAEPGAAAPAGASPAAPPPTGATTPAAPPPARGTLPDVPLPDSRTTPARRPGN
jgi:hypothetical protein